MLSELTGYVKYEFYDALIRILQKNYQKLPLSFLSEEAVFIYVFI